MEIKQDTELFEELLLTYPSRLEALQTTNEVQPAANSPVFAGNSYIGQTKNTYMNFIEVILLSDTKHVLPIKSDFFYCDARGKGKPMLISCKLGKNDDFQHKIGDAVFTSGLGGIFLKDIEIGLISAINSVSINEDVSSGSNSKGNQAFWAQPRIRQPTSKYK